MGIMKEISVKALAKINLGLDVVRRREDGYHEVKMVMQTIHLFDRLEMKKTAGGITMTTNLSFLPTNENNLVYTAAKLLIDKEKGSIGMLQRYFKVGFNRAARIMDQLEEAGIVGPEEGTKPRKVLMSPEQFEQYEEEYL